MLIYLQSPMVKVDLNMSAANRYYMHTCILLGLQQGGYGRLLVHNISVFSLFRPLHICMCKYSNIDALFYC